MNEKPILFQDIFKVEHPEITKVKFNINANDADSTKKATYAWDNLFNNESDSLDDPWIQMNAHKRKHANNNLDRAKYLLAFAQYYPYGADYYIFGGFYKVEIIEPELFDTTGYKLTLLDEFSEYRKRLIIKLSKPIGRDLYNRWYDTVVDSLNPEVYELSPSTKLEKFPGYDSVLLTHKELQKIFRNEAPQWKDALSYVKGVYCITDKSTGKLYIGSAYGNGEGIWQRWSRYADINDLTGGNKTFEEMKENGAGLIIDNFTYSILEIFDMKTKDSDIIHREEYWKRVFQTVEHGMNNNAKKIQKDK